MPDLGGDCRHAEAGDKSPDYIIIFPDLLANACVEQVAIIRVLFNINIFEKRCSK